MGHHVKQHRDAPSSILFLQLLNSPLGDANRRLLSTHQVVRFSWDASQPHTRSRKEIHELDTGVVRGWVSHHPARGWMSRHPLQKRSDHVLAAGRPSFAKLCLLHHVYHGESTGSISPE